MKRKHLIILVLLLSIHGTLFGQIGKTVETFSANWGLPIEGGTSNTSPQTIVFRRDSTEVRAIFREGIARSILYRTDRMEDAWINALLERNSEGLEWHRWQSPKAQGGALNPHPRWIRSDEEAMAELVGEGLRILGIDWHSQKEDSSEPPKAEETIQNASHSISTSNKYAETAPLKTTFPSSPPQGFWVYLKEQNSIRLHRSIQISGDGLMIWREHTPEQSQVYKTRWEPLPTTDTPYPWAVKTVQGVMLGMFRLTTEGLLEFKPSDIQAEDPLMSIPIFGEISLFKPIGNKDDSEEEISECMRGANRSEVLQRYGTPLGTMRAGSNEVLLYPWGQILLRTNTVISIEKKGSGYGRNVR